MFKRIMIKQLPHWQISELKYIKRRGSALLVVVTMLTALMFMGLFFMLFVNTERNNSAAFAAPDNFTESNSTTYFDFALEQLIIGPDKEYKLSALYGCQHSIVPNMIGRFEYNTTAPASKPKPVDLNPFSARGVDVTFTDANNDGIPDDPNFGFDIDHDGINDTLILNYSAAANGGTPQVPTYDPDAGYSSPDINSMFLEHETWVDIDPNPLTPADRRLVIIPSFFKPQYYSRTTIADPYASNIGSFSKSNVLRPHKLHVAEDGTTPRYLTANGTTVNLQGGGTALLDAFPFPANYKMGIWTEDPATVSPVDYELDVDNDGDGVKDSIIMDLNYPIETDSTGQSFVPMVSYQVLDADGLANFNTGGNLNDIKIVDTNGPHILLADLQSLATRADSEGFVSRSNLALSLSELNIGRMFPAFPDGADFADVADIPAFKTNYAGMFGFPRDSTTLTQLQMSNMEVARLLLGAPSYSYNGTTTVLSGDIVTPGRYGADNDLKPSTDTKDLLIGSLAGTYDAFPVPGGANPSASTPALKALVDDDQDFKSPNDLTSVVADTTTLGYAGGAAYRDSQLKDLLIPWFAHPLDYIGKSTLYKDGTNGRVFNTMEQTNNPMSYFLYGDGYQLPGSSTTKILGVNSYYRAFGTNGTLVPNAQLWNFNEDDEVTIDLQHADYSKDSVFAYEQMAELHLSKNDIEIVGNVSSRMRNLAPFNLDLNKQAADIRKQFTTVSFDRREFGMSSTSGVITTAYNRDWEYNDSNKFPPRFTGPDPLRPELRQWLKVELNNTTSSTLPVQRKLNLNRLLDSDGTNPIFRRLTPHPVITSGGAFTFSTSDLNKLHDSAAPTYNANASNKDQEWWARYDRQRMARDIYALLWILGGGDDLKNYTTTPYSSEAAKQMAQFAVNVVDSLDQDNVITKFVYDKDITDGWDTDIEDTANTDHASVYGNELQELTLSEVMWVVTENDLTGPAAGNNRATLFDDTVQDHQFLFIELRNLRPFDVELSTGSYRIRTVQNGAELGKVTFKTGTSTPKKIPAGSNYLIGTHDGEWVVTGGVDNGKTQAAAFRVDLDWDNTGDTKFDSKFYSVIPYVNEPTPPTSNGDYPNPVCDFDLCHLRDRATSSFEEADTSGAVPATKFGYLLPQSTNIVAGTNDQMSIVLERKLNNQVNGLITNDEWLEVDRFTVKASIKSEFNRDLAEAEADQFYDNSTGNGFMPGFVSYSRTQPFEHYTGDVAGNSPQTNKLCRHSLGGNSLTATETPPVINGTGTNTNAEITKRLNQANFSSVTQFTHIQPHFDRDFYSVMELLSIPLYGAGKSATGDEGNPHFNRITSSIADSTLSTPFGLLNPDNGNKMDGHATAQFKFMNTDLTGVTGAPTDLDLLKNHWHRLLNFFYVDGTNDANQLNDPLFKRTPGKVNLNTIRTTGQKLDLNSFLAMIDDEYHLEDFSGLDPHENSAPNPRDWAYQLLMARDGFDVHTATSYSRYITLPGVPGSKPFRSIDFVDALKPGKSLVHTLLRPIPYSSPGSITGILTENFTNNYDGNLLVNASPENHDRRGLLEARTLADLSANNVDYYSRNRLLAKLDNLSTIRSNVFYVWITIQFHEAAVDTAGNTRIGAKLSRDPIRGFFIIDRSNLESAYDQTTNTFDFNKLVVYRRQIQ